MNQYDSLERDLVTWFADSAAPRVPDYVDEIVGRTAHVRQRPRWTFLERWVPQRVAITGSRILRPIPWRTLGLVMILALLLAVALAVYVGSRPRTPPPFGPAANGLIAYSSLGDIITVDPATGSRRVLVSGSELDRDPQWSLDGTRVAFFRGDEFASWLVVADAEGEIVVVSRGRFTRPDADVIAWSPDGRTVAVAAEDGVGRSVFLVDAITGNVTMLPDEYAELEIMWRPSDGRQLLYLGGTPGKYSFHLYSIDEGRAEPIGPTVAELQVLRPTGWTPDGRHFAFENLVPEHEGHRTHVLDLATGELRVLDVGFGRLSNDGTRVVGLNAEDMLCVTPIAGGDCEAIASVFQVPDKSAFGTLQWSPDDNWILSVTEDRGPFLLDPDSGTVDRPQWLLQGAETWQRTAP